jgi:hypothetical protein
LVRTVSVVHFVRGFSAPPFDRFSHVSFVRSLLGLVPHESLIGRVLSGFSFSASTYIHRDRTRPGCLLSKADRIPSKTICPSHLLSKIDQIPSKQSVPHLDYNWRERRKDKATHRKDMHLRDRLRSRKRAREMASASTKGTFSAFSTPRLAGT